MEKISSILHAIFADLLQSHNQNAFQNAKFFFIRIKSSWFFFGKKKLNFVWLTTTKLINRCYVDFLFHLARRPPVSPRRSKIEWKSSAFFCGLFFKIKRLVSELHFFFHLFLATLDLNYYIYITYIYCCGILFELLTLHFKYFNSIFFRSIIPFKPFAHICIHPHSHLLTHSLTHTHIHTPIVT